MNELDNEYRELTLEDILRMFKKRFWFFMAIVIGVVVATGIYLVLATPIYEASVNIKVEPTSKSSVSDIFMNQVTGSYSSKDISTEVELIKSRTNFEEVIRRLGLVDKMYEPEVKERLLSEGYTEDDLVQSLTYTLSEMITVSPVKDTRIVKVAVQHPDPVLAKDIANTLAEVYNEKLAELSKRDITMKKQFIESQIPVLEEDLKKSTNELKAFKEKTGIYVLEEQARWLLQMITTYDQQYNNLQISMEEKIAQKKSYEELLKQFDSSEDKTFRDKWLKTSETLSRNPIIQQLKSKLVELQVELAALRQQYPETDPRVRAKLTQIAETENLIKKETEEFIRTGETQTLNPAYETALTGVISAESTIQILEARLKAVDRLRKEYEKELSKLPTIEQQLLELQRQIAVKENLYTLLLERLEEARISEAAVVGNAAIIDPARVPRYPVKPNKKLSLAIGGVLGIFLGMLAVFLVEYADKTLKTEEEIERYSGVQILGRIPQIQDLKDELHVKASPISPESEAIKMAASNISFILGDKKSFAITSVSPSEGKSFIAANLAYSMASNDTKVILVDLDIRRPRVEKILKLNGRKTKGIVDVVLGKITLNEAILNYEGVFDVLPVGSIPPNPTVILSSKKLTEIFEELKKRYDTIVIDMPPAMVTSDVSMVGNKFDGVLLVVKPGTTPRDGLRIAVQNLRTVNINVLGLLVNGVDEKTSSYYYYYYHYYYTQDGTKKKIRRKKSRRTGE